MILCYKIKGANVGIFVTLHFTAERTFFSRTLQVNTANHAWKSSRCQGPEESPPRNQIQAIRRKEEEEKDPQGKLLYLHLQGPETGPPRYWHLQQGHEHHELVCERHLRAYCFRSVSSGSLQQETHHHQSRGPDCRSSTLARRAEQARSQ